MVDMGAKWVRVPLSWKAIEPSDADPAAYSWQTYDSIFGQAASAGMQVIATITDNPSWAGTNINGPIDKVSKDKYGDFLRALVSRYKGPQYTVKYWEIFNEPDNTWQSYCSDAESGISCWGNDPAGYVDLMATSYAAIKETDPGAQVILGSLSMDWFTDEGGPFARDFLNQVLAKGGGQFFDVVGFHYFPIFRWRWNQYGKDIIGKATYIRQVLAKYGIDKPLLASETGMWSDDRMGGNEEVQAEYVPQVFSRGMATGLTAAIWFMLHDDASWSAKHGLLNPDLTPKPAYFAYQIFTAQLQGMHYEKTLAFSGASGWDLEGYSFVDASGGRISVVWSNSGTTGSLSIAANQVRRVDLYGAVSDHNDADDGAIDGKVAVQVGPSPVYLRVLQ